MLIVETIMMRRRNKIKRERKKKNKLELPAITNVNIKSSTIRMQRGKARHLFQLHGHRECPAQLAPLPLQIPVTFINFNLNGVAGCGQ